MSDRSPPASQLLDDVAQLLGHARLDHDYSKLASRARRQEGLTLALASGLPPAA